jgi:DNA-directed RNA polymerase subunit RPC12/RpoP
MCIEPLTGQIDYKCKNCGHEETIYTHDHDIVQPALVKQCPKCKSRMFGQKQRLVNTSHPLKKY